MKPCVDVLLSTYNGSLYIGELFGSILSQSYLDWRLLVRDDGSSDDTVEIIRCFAEKYPDKIIYFNDEYPHLGPSQSFSRLMDFSDARYIMFCDQDDVWLDNKIELLMEKMLLLEKEHPNEPRLVHSDLSVVDEGLNLLSHSMWEYQKLNPQYKSLNHLLIQNNVTGCAMVINKRLKEVATPIPIEAKMHDWWIALVASIYSGVNYIDEPTILYRQHGNNNTGARRFSFRYLLTRLGNANKSISNILVQAQKLGFRYHNQLNKNQKHLLSSFNQLSEQKRLTRIFLILKCRFKMYGFFRNFGFLVSMFCYRRGNIE